MRIRGNGSFGKLGVLVNLINQNIWSAIYMYSKRTDKIWRCYNTSAPPFRHPWGSTAVAANVALSFCTRTLNAMLT